MAIVFRQLVISATALALLCVLAVVNAYALQCDPLVESDRTLSTAGFDRGLLWRIEGTSERPSYVFGTIHISDPRVTDVAQTVTAAFDSSQRPFPTKCDETGDRSIHARIKRRV